MYQVVEEYFRRKGQKIEFDETKLNFLLFNLSENILNNIYLYVNLYKSILQKKSKVY